MEVESHVALYVEQNGITGGCGFVVGVVSEGVVG